MASLLLPDIFHRIVKGPVAAAVAVEAAANWEALVSEEAGAAVGLSLEAVAEGTVADR